jgi:hypothetical protein
MTIIILGNTLVTYGRQSPITLLDETSYIDPLSRKYTVVREYLNEVQLTPLLLKSAYVQFIYPNGTVIETIASYHIQSNLKTGIILPSYGKIPVKIIFDEPELSNQVGYHASTLNYETVEISKTTGLKSTCNEIALVESNPDKGYAKWKITGIINNNSKLNATNVYVVSSLYDERGRIVGIAESQANLRVIHPSGSTTVELLSLLPISMMPVSCYIYAESEELWIIAEPLLPLYPIHIGEPEFFNQIGNFLIESNVGGTITIAASIANIVETPQNLVVIVLVKDQEGITEQLAWREYALDSKKQIILNQDWIASKPDNYIIEIFVWSSIENPSVLSPSVRTAFEVK